MPLDKKAGMTVDQALWGRPTKAMQSLLQQWQIALCPTV
jgi:hypothetical protein